MGYYLPETYIGKLELDWVDLYVGYYSREQSVSLHLHFMPDNEDVRRTIYRILTPLCELSGVSYKEAKECHFKVHEFGLGCGMGFFLNKKIARELTEKGHYTDGQKQALKKIVWGLFKSHA